MPTGITKLIFKFAKNCLYPLSENLYFFGPEHLMNLRPVPQFEFGPCGPVKKIKTLYPAFITAV